MAKTAACFIDNAGTPHTTPEDAVLADIAAVIGRQGRDGQVAGMAPGLAKLILANRAEIEAAFADLDAMTAPKIAKVA